MARLYSLDLRERVVAQVARDMTHQTGADRNGIVSSSVSKWCGRKRASGTSTAKPMGGHRPRKLKDERDWLLARLAGKPDLTRHELLAELADKRQVAVACDTLWWFLKREDVSFKKTVHASEQDRPDVARRRVWWQRMQSRLDPKRLVFIDETWTKTNMTRTRSWWRRGKRLMAKAPHGHWQTITFLAALRHNAIVAPCVLDGPINGESFAAYVEQILAPTLRPRQERVAPRRRPARKVHAKRVRQLLPKGRI